MVLINLVLMAVLIISGAPLQKPFAAIQQRIARRTSFQTTHNRAERERTIRASAITKISHKV